MKIEKILSLTKKVRKNRLDQAELCVTATQTKINQQRLILKTAEETLIKFEEKRKRLYSTLFEQVKGKPLDITGRHFFITSKEKIKQAQDKIHQEINQNKLVLNELINKLHIDKKKLKTATKNHEKITLSLSQHALTLTKEQQILEDDALEERLYKGTSD